MSVQELVPTFRTLVTPASAMTPSNVAAVFFEPTIQVGLAEPPSAGPSVPRPVSSPIAMAALPPAMLATVVVLLGIRMPALLKSVALMRKAVSPTVVI